MGRKKKARPPQQMYMMVALKVERLREVKVDQDRVFREQSCLVKCIFASSEKEAKTKLRR